VQQPDTTIAPCHPARLDTVLGVRGIITAFDARPGAYGFYIQSSFSKGPMGWTGVDVFTGATNYNSAVPGTPTGGNLVLGDSVVVYGTTQEFPATNGETEIEGPDAIQGSNDIIIRKISSGNALPPAHVGTTAEFNWVPAISGATAEPWEGCLVRINGPLKVARTSGTGVDGNNFLLVNPLSAGDSVLVDGFTLFLFGTPPLGSTVGFVQGILNQRNSTGGTGTVNSYRIQLRDVNDINVDAPPNLVEAYPLEDNKLRLLFDKNLDEATAENIGNYSLGSGIDGSTVDVATLVGGAGTTVELDITSVRNDGDPETITAQNIGTATCPLCLSSSQTLSFAQGVITIAMIQAPDPASLSPCDDRSRFAGAGTALGTRLTVRGVATQSYGSLYYIQDEAGGARSGVSIFAPLTPLVSGHKYRVACRVQEFGGETEISNTVNILDEGTGTVPAATKNTVADLADTTCDAGQIVNTGEDWEGTLIVVNQVRVVNFNTDPVEPAPGGSFRVVQPAYPVGGPADTILVSAQDGHYTYDPTEGDKLDVTGVLHQANNSFRILPRSDGDIAFKKNVDVENAPPVELALRVGPNPGTSQNVTFALPKAGDVDLGVYDLSGRHVATIERGPFKAGTYSRAWNGRDAQGRTVGAGMYFYRLRIGEETRLVRAVRIR
jgi:hypothetical protein